MPAPAGFRLRFFLLALVVGGVLEVVILAFGLHASLFLGSILSGRPYWVANGLVLSLGLAIGFAIVPWHRRSIRAETAAALLVVGALIGALSPT